MVQFISPWTEVHSQNPKESLFELSIGKSIAEGVDRRAYVAHPIRQTVKMAVNTGVGLSGVITEALDKNYDMVWSPAQHKSPKD